jgi:hypothetical protein
MKETTKGNSMALSYMVRGADGKEYGPVTLEQRSCLFRGFAACRTLNQQSQPAC